VKSSEEGGVEHVDSEGNQRVRGAIYDAPREEKYNGPPLAVAWVLKFIRGEAEEGESKTVLWG